MALKTLLSAVTATGASLAVSTDSNKAAFIQVSGITSATVAAQGSVDGSTWSTIGTALTADGLITITNPPPYRDWETDRKSTRLNSSHRL